MSATQTIQMAAAWSATLGMKIGQCRAMPVRLGSGSGHDGIDHILLVGGADFDVDPFREMFYFPTDTLKLILLETATGKEKWRVDLGRGVVPGLWFCPVLAFDLDGDGTDEIYVIGNTKPDHPMSTSGAVIERRNGATGEVTGQWPWPIKSLGEVMSHMFRRFFMAGHIHGEPILITGQGTYQAMLLTGWNADMSERWTCEIPADSPGARGSHMCPVVDIDSDGVDELMWGERCIKLDTGREMFCCDRDVYRGHSDVIQPFQPEPGGPWMLYTIRESDGQASPRVVMYNDAGQRVWGDVDEGHMDMGWVARLGDDARWIASAIRIGGKSCGADGRHHRGMTEFAFDALTGEPIDLGYSTYRTLPVDVDGDGRHELVRGRASGDGELLDTNGNVVTSLGGAAAMVSRFLDAPGEQILTYQEDGTIKAWQCENAEDSPRALRRYQQPFYRTNQLLTGTGYNLVNLGGI